MINSSASSGNATTTVEAQFKNRAELISAICEDEIILITRNRFLGFLMNEKKTTLQAVSFCLPEINISNLVCAMNAIWGEYGIANTVEY